MAPTAPDYQAPLQLSFGVSQIHYHHYWEGRMAARKSVRRVASVRTHAVRAQLNVQELTKAGTSLLLEISARGEKIGELEIGRGALYWRGGRRQTRKRLVWSRFAELMDELAYGGSRPAARTG